MSLVVEEEETWMGSEKFKSKYIESLVNLEHFHPRRVRFVLSLFTVKASFRYLLSKSR